MAAVLAGGVGGGKKVYGLIGVGGGGEKVYKLIGVLWLGLLPRLGWTVSDVCQTVQHGSFLGCV